MPVWSVLVRWVLLVADTTAVGPRLTGWGCQVALDRPPVVAVQCPVAVTRDSLQRVPGVQSAELDRLESVPSEVAAPATWGLTAIRADTAWNRGLTGAGVTVAVLDSGLEVAHPGFGGRARCWSAVGADTLACGDWPVCNGHGTHVAGTVASTLYGVAPGAQVVGIRVFETINGGCAAWSSTQITGVMKSRTSGWMIGNASIGGSYSAAYQYHLDLYRQQGGVFVASSGNAGAAFASCPACYTGVLSVGALASPTAVASYSNRDPDLDLVAPGSNTLSTMPGGQTGTKSGTSMAAPHVAGAVALIRQRLPTISPDSVTALLYASVVDRGPVGVDPAFGRGTLDLERLVRVLIPRAPVASVPRTLAVGATGCVMVTGRTGPWTATSTHPGLVVWTTDNAVCWRADAPGTGTVTLRSL